VERINRLPENAIVAAAAMLASRSAFSIA